MNKENKWCVRCKEEFPVAPENQHLQMGWLFPLERVSERVKRRLHEDKTSGYLCGNCWHDILDEIDEEEDR
jgi:DNA-directed RNA polymerase subunit RPC12/RpoP